MKKSVKILVMMLALMMVAAAFLGCADKKEEAADGAAADDKLVFAWSPATLDNPYFITVTEGFEARCKELGVEPLVADPAYDAEKQYGQFENWIAMGVDAISACPVDTRSLEEVTAKAQEAGIIVVGEAQGIANADANVIVDDYEYGVANGEACSKMDQRKARRRSKSTHSGARTMLKLLFFVVTVWKTL